MPDFQPAARKTAVSWVLVASGKSATVYGRETDNAEVPTTAQPNRPGTIETRQSLKAVDGLSWQAQSAEAIYDVNPDKLGRVFQSYSSQRSMSEPPIDARQEVKLDLMKTAAEAINGAHLAGRFERLTVIAPAKLLGELRKLFSKGVLATIEAEIPKDLTAESPHQLASHLTELV
ncbi:host attachment protein [Asticcacaulis machinosus]|uniref:Host attachment protein n=1 Tax=Asticcacaulis machinosus TaxID=2984211 RepID=A0ABT5HNB2_9CAUL|nr:host attachment protein [Asticcacaulis machinosus]MDC7677736.1 host attachment protein [Asticcacaulis machinosus]